MKPLDKEKDTGSTRRLRSRVPDAARVPRVAFRGAVAGDDGRLRIARRASVEAAANLAAIAERVRRGDDSGLDALLPGGFGATRRGLEGCNHYLPANRFEWWHLESRGLVPRTQPIGVFGSSETVDVDVLFYSEFCSPLSTVFGADLHLVEWVGAARSLSWETEPDGENPNSFGNPDIGFLEFHVRVTRPSSVPVFKEVEVILGPGSRTKKTVILNGVEEDQELDPSQPRPSLFIDWFAGQRAVGLECGFLGEDGREINPQSVRLIARNVAGEILVESTGADLFPQPWRANAVFYHIGVRDREGAIRSVELRFEDPNEPILEPQIVYRIWHEPLPHSAVRQGTAAVEWDPSPPSDGENTLRVPPHDGPLGPVTIKLPFRCDRAVVMLRGFKMFFLDQQPHKVDGIEAHIGDSESSEAGAGVFQTRAGGSITLVPRGRLSAGPENGYRVLIYYLVLAWDSQYMELLTASGHDADIHDPAGDFTNGITMQDPCGSPPCELFPGLQGFRFAALRERQNVEELSLAMGHADFSNPLRTESHVRRTDGKIEWSVDTSLVEVTRTSRAVQGTVLAGRYVHRGATSRVLAREFRNFPDRFERRDPRSPFFFIADRPELALLAEGDMAVLALGMFSFKPEGKIRELEIEVQGTDYDGRRIQWQIGGGISVSRPVTGGAGTSRKRYLVGWPVFGAVLRKATHHYFSTSVQHVRFDRGVRGALSLEPDRYGAIRNDGNVPLVITQVERRGPQADEFNFLIEYGGQVLRDDELAARAPVLLYPGETWLIGGRFFPQEDTVPNGPPRKAQLYFVANFDQFINAEGRTIPQQPHGAALPRNINFGFVNVNASNHPLGFPSRNVLLISDGQTPLLVHSLTLEDSALGLTFGIRDPGRLTPDPVTPGILYQVEEGDAMVVEIRFVPVGIGPVETRLIAETNAGRLEVRLAGEGVS